MFKNSSKENVFCVLSVLVAVVVTLINDVVLNMQIINTTIAASVIATSFFGATFGIFCLALPPKNLEDRLLNIIYLIVRFICVCLVAGVVISLFTSLAIYLIGIVLSYIVGPWLIIPGIAVASIALGFVIKFALNQRSLKREKIQAEEARKLNEERLQQEQANRQKEIEERKRHMSNIFGLKSEILFLFTPDGMVSEAAARELMPWITRKLDAMAMDIENLENKFKENIHRGSEIDASLFNKLKHARKDYEYSQNLAYSVGFRFSKMNWQARLPITANVAQQIEGNEKDILELTDGEETIN